METFQSLLAKRLSDALAKAGLPNAGELTPATDRRFGDYQTNAALVLRKQRSENPQTLAERVITRFDIVDLCEPTTVADPSFLHLKLHTLRIDIKAVDVLQ